MTHGIGTLVLVVAADSDAQVAPIQLPRMRHLGASMPPLRWMNPSPRHHP
jgi:hypothetical protein